MKRLVILLFIISNLLVLNATVKTPLIEVFTSDPGC